VTTGGPWVEVAPAPPLRFLLPARDRAAGVRRLPHDPDATLGHLVQAAGVPLTEAGPLLLDGRPAAPADRARPGARVAVAERPRPEPAPAGGFLLDVGLGGLARRLRLLGLDAAYWPQTAPADADDALLVARAAAEDRVLLTQDRGLLMRRALPRGALVRGTGTAAQLADVLDRFAPPLAPLSRCTACGGSLAAVAEEDVADLLPAGTRRTYSAFSRCRSCGRVYWRGAHMRRIDTLVGQALVGQARAAGYRRTP
jgi:uncharacterized protein with PIN domain